MKKLAVIIALAATAAGAFAQGTINFANTATTRIVWGNGPLPPGAVAGANISAAFDVHVGLYYLGPTGSEQNLFLATGLIPKLGTLSSGNTNATVDGRFTGAVATVPITPGSTGIFVIKAWSGNFANYEAAQLGGSTIGGISPQFSNITGGVPDPGNGIPGASASLNFLGGNFVNLVPEPSTFALAALGAGALVFLRRRK